MVIDTVIDIKICSLTYCWATQNSGDSLQLYELDNDASKAFTIVKSKSKVQSQDQKESECLDSSSQKNWLGGQWDQGNGVVLHVQEEVYQLTLTFKGE